MTEKLRRTLLDNPPTAGEAAVGVVIALLVWGAQAATAYAPGYVVSAVAIFIGVLAIGAIGRATQRWTLPTEWLDAETVRQLTGRDR